MALTADQLRNLSRLYDRWEGGDLAAREAVQHEVNAAGGDVTRAFAKMVAYADSGLSAMPLTPIPSAMREAALLAAGEGSAHKAGSAASSSDDQTLSIAADTHPREPGQRIGPYRLIKELGRGGMGVVWLAERADGQHTRQVALKMPLVENLNWLLAARFARERNILASLEHPGIARLYDAGIDDSDRFAQPYIAIEYVQGRQITDYVRERRLKPEATAQLFIRVIEAVAHAHAQLVIHRDIKPSNILVDAKGEPHLLDFGIAKLLDDEDSQNTEATQLTRLSGRALTLDYASPEQVSNASLGTASDVYSLGIVLYESLTGRRPYDPKDSTRRELEQAILEQDPAKPSDQLMTIGDSESGKSARRMRGDLDTVVLKALRKDPKQRYATAQAFADDLKRYLAYEPIAAKPDAGWYQAMRFLRRNRVAMMAGTAVFLSLAAGIVAVSFQAAHIEQRRAEADIAKKEALAALTDAEASADLLMSVLTNSSGATTTMALLGSARTLIEKLYATSPATRARLQIDISNMLIPRGEYETATLVLENAVAAARQAGSEDLVAIAQCKLAENNARRGQMAESLRLLNTVISQLELSNSARSEGLTACLISRAIFNSERGADAALVDADATTALGRLQSRSGTLSTRTYLMSLLAETKAQVGNFHEAIQMFRQAIALLEASGQGELTVSRTARGGLSLALSEAGQALDALTVARRNFEDSVRDEMSHAHPAVVNYASLLRDVGRLDESESLLAKALGDAYRTKEPQAIAFVTVVSARTACEKRLRASCTALATEALKLIQQQVGPQHPAIAMALTTRGIAYLLEGETGPAIAALSDGKARFAVARGARIRGVVAMTALTDALIGVNDIAGARENARQALALAEQSMYGFRYSEWMGRALLSLAKLERADLKDEAARATATSSALHLRYSLGEASPKYQEAKRLAEMVR
jgi:eukaryotic-like serine/threonine-protein kinase